MFRKSFPISILFFAILIILVLSACASAASGTGSSSAPAAEQATQSSASGEPSAASSEPTVAALTQPSAASAGQEATQSQSAQAQGAPARLNLNASTADQFLTISGVGSRMVREFMEYRPYVSILQFRREIGKYVSADQVAEYEKYVFVPISINESDAETLQQIPGLDAAAAQQLMDGRPYASTDDFLTRLAEFVSESDLSIAKTYLNN
jgi:DNA uptake protein ComE-like DNA-binding protein